MAQRAAPMGTVGWGIDRKSLGLTDDEATFSRMFRDHGLPRLNKDNGEKVTPPLPLRRIRQHPTLRARYKGWAAAHLGAQAKVHKETDVDGARKLIKAWLETKGDLYDTGEQKALTGESKAVQKDTTDSATVGIPSADGAVPLVYDPEVLQILTDATPILDRLVTRGQQGFKAVVNRIDARGGPIGFTTESNSANLQDDTASEPTYGQTEKAMEIMVDMVEVTDFAQMATEIQFDLRNSALGAALANLGQLKERAVLYADPGEAKSSGDIGDSNAYKGIEEELADNASSNHIDKSSVSIDGTLGLIKDIKAEIKERLQSNDNVSPADLLIATSHTVVDRNENDMQNFVRVAEQVDGVNVGGGQVFIHGVPVVPSHNVDAHSDSGYTPGDEGDVFILNQRSVEFRNLMPMSSVPLARRGFAEQIAIGEFGAPVLRANGNWSKYLSAYPVTQLT